MNKKMLLLALLIALSVGFACAQNKIDKFCSVSVFRKATISLGEYRGLFALKDTTMYQKLNFVNELTTPADVLNYMTKLGWTVIEIHGTGAWEILYFKKSFDKSELLELASN